MGEQQDNPKATNKMSQTNACKHAQAIILSAFGSCNGTSWRMYVQGQWQMPCGIVKKIGIAPCHNNGKLTNFDEQVWTSLIQELINNPGKYTKFEAIAVKDRMFHGADAS